jgi:hypothetical protein
MAKNGNYPIVIAALQDGRGIVGAWGVKNNLERVVQTDRVYGSQIRHRVVAMTPDGPQIMTPSAAREAGYKFQGFPVRPWYMS